jgi:hypothetical protein
MTTDSTRLPATKDAKMKKVCTKMLPKILAAGKQETCSKFLQKQKEEPDILEEKIYYI